MCFSWITFILPLIGAFFSLPVSIFLICLLFVSKALLGFGVMTMGLPTMVAALSWSEKMQKNRLIKFALNALLPVLCIILFVTHPVASKAFAYSFYWFIPVVIYFLKTRTNFGVALSSTFLAHAVGSIIWLYSVPVTYEKWIALIPVVAAERLIMASAMALVFYALNRVASISLRTDTQDQDSYDKQYPLQACKALGHNRP
jgi:hypothetical protein